jgi:hypothetical protein
MSNTYFDLSKEYAILLEKEGLDADAKRLNDIIESTFSSTELLMGTRYVLSSIDLDKISEVGRKKILEYLRKIDELLGSNQKY